MAASQPMRVLGIDPGLTRCGVGIVDVARDRSARLVAVTVIRTPVSMPLERRLLEVGDGVDELIALHAPDAVAIERVFAQHNLRTVMGTAQVSGVALHIAARHGLAVGLHTPSEVKMAITGYGGAQKPQVQAMVARVLGLTEVPKPADAADALAIAICHAWRGSLGGALGADRLAAGSAAGAGTGTGLGQVAGLTPAQLAWRNAERSGSGRRAAPVSDAPRRLSS